MKRIDYVTIPLIDKMLEINNIGYMDEVTLEHINILIEELRLNLDIAIEIREDLKVK